MAWHAGGKSWTRIALSGGVLAVVVQAAIAAETPLPVLRTSEGLEILPAAVAPSVEFPMFATLDDRGRLFVAESSGGDLYDELQKQTRRCRIRLLEDKDGDGRYERSSVWADKLVFPMGLAWRDGKLYVADPPDLITLRDTDGDGVADERRVLLTGFGHRDNGSLHGLIFGRDGWLYMTMGAPDGYRLKRGDGTMLEGESGALIRCRVDGREPEVVARGFVNLVEVAFTPRGEIIGTDNWFQQPRGGMRDALVHVVEGGLYPYEPDKGTAQPVTGAPLPAMQMYPAVAHSGVALIEGSALRGMSGNLLSAQHNSRRVLRHELIAKGSTYETRDHELVTTDDPDFHPSDVLEDGDGTVLVVDTGSWYIHHCPTGQIRQAASKGGIYRVRPRGWTAPRDPWGLEIDWRGATDEQLVEFLDDARWAVRERASRLLVGRGAASVPTLVGKLRNDQRPVVSQRLIWILSQIGGKESSRALTQALDNQHADVVVTAARGLAMCGDRDSGLKLAKLLSHPSPAVQLAAVEALGRCGSIECLPAVWAALRKMPERFVNHALTLAAYRLGDEESLAEAAADDHASVRCAAMLILEQRFPKRLNPGDVFIALRAEDTGLRAAARWVLLRHGEWGDEALRAVRDSFEKSETALDQQRQVRELLHAFEHHEGLQAWVAESISDASIGPKQRAMLLSVVAESARAALPKTWIEAVGRALGDEDSGVRLAAVRAAAVRQMAELDGKLGQVVDDDAAETEIRFEALRATVFRHPQISAKAFELLLSRLARDRTPIERLAAAEVIARCRLSDEELSRLIEQVRDDPLISPSSVGPIFYTAGGELRNAVADYLIGAVERGWQPGKLEATRIMERLAGADAGKLTRLQALIDGQQGAIRAQLREYGPLLGGGDVELGRQVFFGKQVACASCHAVGSQGGAVGPDLSKIGAVRAPADLLEAIVSPSASVAQGFDTYVLTLSDGRTVMGVLAGEAGEVVAIRDSAGNELRLARHSIEGMQRSATSTMPDGLARSLSRAELQGLLAYLRSLK